MLLASALPGFFFLFVLLRLYLEEHENWEKGCQVKIYSEFEGWKILYWSIYGNKSIEGIGFIN